MERVELQPTTIVAGGDALARDGDGRVVFVEGALPGERVVASIVEERRDFRRAVAVDVLEASPDRVTPPCSNVALGCGGCGWQHVAVEAQHGLKETIVRDALVRIAGLEPGLLPPLRTVAVADAGFRTTARVAVSDGVAAYRRHRSRALVAVRSCHVAHPLLVEVLGGGFGDAAEAVVRVSVATGERVALLRPHAAGSALPDDVHVVDDRAVRTSRRGVLREEVRGRRLEVSIDSFFQSSPGAGTALVDAVLTALGPVEGARVADLYAGVGVFADAVAARGASVVAVESNRAAVEDAKVNLAWAGAPVVRSDVGRWRDARPFDAVVADPARPGLGRPGAAAVVATGADVVVLVSCDPASFARDASLLARAGLELDGAVLVDAFPHTPHVEVVSRFRRRSAV